MTDKVIKTLIPGIALILCSLLSLSSCGGSGSNSSDVSNTNFEETEIFTTTLPVGNQTQFTLIGKSGTVSITGIPGATSVVISATKRVQSESSTDAQAQLQKLLVEVQDLTDEVDVETIEPSDKQGRNYIVDYTITLPSFFEVHVQNLNGMVTLDTIDNDVTVLNLNGDISLTKILGSVEIALLNGDIDGEITLPLNGQIEMETLNGDIDLLLPVNTSAVFSATVSIGSINVTNLVLQNETRTTNFLSGTLGSGQGRITLETEQIGDISVLGV